MASVGSLSKNIKIDLIVPEKNEEKLWRTRDKQVQAFRCLQPLGI